jgi:hypothetical protein
MGLNPDVLFQDLLQDLAPHLKETDAAHLMGGWNPDLTDATVERFRAVSLAKSFVKKLADDTASDASQKAIDKFLVCNQRCREFKLRPSSPHDEQVVLLTRKILFGFVDRWMPDLNLYDCLVNGRVGPGSSMGATGQDLYSKIFASTHTCASEGLLRHWKPAMQFDPRWKLADENRQTNLPGYRIVEGSRLTTVPKTKEIDRVICTEPSVNMWYQLGLAYCLNRALIQGFGFNPELQPDRNRALAKEGSITGRFATIDLASASDTISHALCWAMLPPRLWGLINIFRCRSTFLPNGKKEKLHMVSSMGNGFTFPLQTLLFTAIAVAVYHIHGRPVIKPRRAALDREAKLGNLGVFGDDIIVESDLYESVVSALHLFGFEVNQTKSFYTGPFRESCGHDYYHGHNVRGVYIKSLKTPQARYTAINRLVAWSVESNIDLPRTLKSLKKTVKPIYVPLWESDDCGIKVPWDVAKTSITVESKAWVQLALYKRYVPRPYVIRVKDDVLKVPDTLKPRIFNPEGLYLAFIAGSLRQYEISIRQDRVQYRLKPGTTPNWDYPEFGILSGAGRSQVCFIPEGMLRLKTLAAISLMG